MSTLRARPASKRDGFLPGSPPGLRSRAPPSIAAAVGAAVTWLAQAVPWLVAAALCGIGLGALGWPRSASRQYGVPADAPAALAFVRATGARDLVLGLVVAALAVLDQRPGLRAAIGLGSLLAIADFVIVAAAAGRAGWRSLAVHGLGAVGLLVALGLLAAFDLRR